MQKKIAVQDFKADISVPVVNKTREGTGDGYEEYLSAIYLALLALWIGAYKRVVSLSLAEFVLGGNNQLRPLC